MIPKAAPLPPKKLTPFSQVKAEVRDEPWQMLIHGLPGLGKSTLASKMPDPVFICAETHGADELCVSRYPDAIESFDEFRIALQRLTEEQHTWKTLVIDMLDDIEPLVFKDVCRADGKAQTIEEVGGGFFKGYTNALSWWRVVLADLERLIAKRRMNVVLIAHSTRRNFKNPQGDNYDRWEPAIDSRAAKLFVGWCKEVLFVEEAQAIAKDKQGRNAKAFSSGVRQIRTRFSPAYDAKNRHSLPDPLPLDYDALAVAMSARQVGTPEQLIETIRQRLEQLGNPDVTAKATAFVDANRTNPQELAICLNRLDALLEEKK